MKQKTVPVPACAHGMGHAVSVCWSPCADRRDAELTGGGGQGQIIVTMAPAEAHQRPCGWHHPTRIVLPGVGPYSRPTVARQLVSWACPSRSNPPTLASHIKLMALVRKARQCRLVGMGIQTLNGLSLGEQLGGMCPQRGIMWANQQHMLS